MLRYHPKYAETDPDSPQAWGTCDRCGFVWNLNRLTWQYDYRGSAVLQNIRLLVCPKCLDVPQQQLTPNVLPPDPPPFYNARPEPYTIDETDWLAAEDDSIIISQDTSPFITQIPNPGTAAQANQNSVVQQAEENITTEDGVEIVTEAGDGNPLNYEPNPPDTQS